MADPIPNKYAVNRGNANVAASPLMPTWDGKGDGIASVDENIGNEVGNAFANRKEYTPLSKYRVRPSSSNHKRSTSSPPARLGNGKQQTVVENIRAVALKEGSPQENLQRKKCVSGKWINYEMIFNI